MFLGWITRPLPGLRQNLLSISLRHLKDYGIAVALNGGSMAQSFGKKTNGKTEMLHCYTWIRYDCYHDFIICIFIYYI